MWSELIEDVVGPVVINCDRDTLRWRELQEHLARWDIQPCRFPAVTSASRFVPFNVPAYAAFLSLSWAEVLRQFHQDAHPFLLVLEDDCRFLEDPKTLVREALTACGGGWSVISLGGWKHKPPRTDYTKTVFEQPVWNLWGSHSVLVNRAHALRLADVLETLTQSDQVLNLEYKAKRGFARRPAATYQHEYVSHRSHSTLPSIKYADFSTEQKKKFEGV